MIKHTIGIFLLALTGLTGALTSNDTPTKETIHRANHHDAVHAFHSSRVEAQEVIHLSEVVISVPRPKAPPAVSVKEQPKAPACLVRELTQGSGLVRICG